jgi:hypothetical protein
MGGDEVLNRERAYEYGRTAGCPIGWFMEAPSGSLHDALGDEKYAYSKINQAPWYDATRPETARFLGAYPTKILGITDSTRGAQILQGIRDGGVVQSPRRAIKEVRATAMLIGMGPDALEAGAEWLNSAVDPSACGSHDSACGETDLCFFTTSPPLRGQDVTDDDYEEILQDYRRRMHGVMATSGPFVLQEFSRDGFNAYVVEFTLTAGKPYVYSMPRRLPITPLLPTLVEDVPRNIVPSPTAEVGGAAIVISRNKAPNPSVEINGTDWVGAVTSVSGSAPAAYHTHGRVNDLAAEGSWSYRSRLLGSGAAAASGVADLDVYSEAPIDAGSNRRCSVNMWASLALIGAGTLTSLAVSYEFFNGGSSLGAAVNIGSISTPEFSGKAVSVAGIAVPASATKVRVRARARVSWASTTSPGASNSDIRLYADALAVTIP